MEALRFIKNSNHGFAAASFFLLVPHEATQICKMDFRHVSPARHHSFHRFPAQGHVGQGQLPDGR
jgi:hypothetical protein